MIYLGRRLSIVWILVPFSVFVLVPSFVVIGAACPVRDGGGAIRRRRGRRRGGGVAVQVKPVKLTYYGRVPVSQVGASQQTARFGRRLVS